MSLTELLRMARTQELAEIQAAGMEHESANESANALKKQIKKRSSETDNTSKRRVNQAGRKCYNCAGDFPHEKECPARGKTCTACGNFNHFAIACRSTRNSRARNTKFVKNIEVEDQSSEEEYAFNINGRSIKTPKITVSINSQLMTSFVDTGDFIVTQDGEDILLCY